MENIQWKVEGMDCSNCAITIHKYLEKKGMKNIKVNFASGDVFFDLNGEYNKEEIAKGIDSLGYTVTSGIVGTRAPKRFLHTHLQRFLFCLPFTAVLWFHMIPGLRFHFLMDPWTQLLLALPVYVIGMSFFGKSAYKSLRNGMPNMNLLISLGATAAFAYSLYGTIIGNPTGFMFYETAATIITLVFMGNYLEEASVHSTQRALNALIRSQKVMANMITYDDQHQEHLFRVENTQLRVGDLLLIKTGERVPMDCKILWGEGQINEAIITGESLPVEKKAKDKLIGGSIIISGTIKAQVTAVGSETILAGIINMVKQAQGEKPPVQKLADKISGIFVPVVIGIALVTLCINWIVLGNFTAALMRSIAVLVIACPCAMGLATPAAIAVGLGRGAKNGILFRNASSLEFFKDIRQVVFDKTGTLTTGEFVIGSFYPTIDEQSFKDLVYSLEKYSTHPLAKAITKEWKTNKLIEWTKVEEIKGLGMKAIDKKGDEYQVGSFSIAAGMTTDESHNIYVTRNKELIGWIDLRDEIRPEAISVINYLHSKNINTILLTGDRQAPANELAKRVGIDMVFAGQTPAQKMDRVAELSAEKPTAMVGDGINDAPALAKATVGISLSDASQLAMQSAQVVLMNHGLKKLPTALGLGRHTYYTIRQNLFWAFAYNIVAIPVAALGFLTPSFGALVMGFSDVVLALNSIRLFVKKVE